MNDINKYIENIEKVYLQINDSFINLLTMDYDMETYKNAPDFLKFKTGDDLEQKLEAILKKKASYYSNVDMFRNIGAKRFLELPENIGCHLEALNTPYGSPDRNYLRKWNS